MVEKTPYDPNFLEGIKDSFLSLQGVLEKKLEQEEERLLELQRDMPELIRLKKLMDEMDALGK